MSDSSDPYDDILSDKNEQARNARRLDVDDIKWLLSTKRGRRIVYRLLTWTGIFKSSFNHSGSIMAFNEGARYVGLTMLAQVNDADPMAFATMSKEQQEDERNTNGDGRSTSTS